MRVLFVDNFPINFGVTYSASALQFAGHEVSLLNYPISKWAGIDIYANPNKYFDFERIADEVIDSAADVVACSVFSPNFLFYKTLATHIKQKRDLPIVVGGVLPSLYPDLFLEDSRCDAVFRGESEPIIDDLVHGLVDGRLDGIPNVVYRSSEGKIIRAPMTSYVEDLDQIPYCDKELYPNNFGNLYMLTSRGCAMSCTFCSAGEFSRMTAEPGKRVVRKRRVDSVIDEMKEALAKSDYRQIYFYDDFFITTKNWLEEFAESYKREINLPFYCEAFPATVSPIIAKLLSAAGCKSVMMGFQTANDAYKKNVLKRAETNEKVVRAISSLRQNGVTFSLDHIFNFPGETDEDLEQSLRFYLEHDIRNLNIFFLNYFPDSHITRYAYEEGFLTPEEFQKILKNEMVGEQSFMGTILDEALSKRQVKIALLFKLMNFLPKSFVMWIWRTGLYEYFPTNKILYYLISGLNELLGRGLPYLRLVYEVSFARPSMRPPATMLSRLRRTFSGVG